MRKIYHFFFFVFFVFGAKDVIHAQNADLPSLLADLERYASTSQYERVHLHLDKPYYAAGDDIWIKAYVVIGAENKLSDLSKILYVDLLDEQQVLIGQRKIPLVAGLGIGDIHLPDTLKGGVYKLRAYTNWMRNFESSTHFEQYLPVLSLHEEPGQRSSRAVRPGNDRRAQRLAADRTADASAGHIPHEVTLQFFPEGGTLLAGHDNRVAFKATGSDGAGVHLEGTLVDAEGTKILDFKGLGSGMGSFIFRPEPGKEYFAGIRSGDGALGKVKLPDVQDSGITLAVNNLAEGRVYVELKATPDMIDGREVSLVLQKDGEVFYAAKRKLNAAVSQFSVAKELLPMGVVQVTVFSEQLQPWSERVIFSMNESFVLPVSITSDQASYGSRKKARLRVEVGLETDTNRYAALSAAVIDLDKIGYQGDGPWNIYTSLLTSPYIRGVIENPTTYFDQDNPLRMQQLDLLLMTQAWSRIDWSQIHVDRAADFQFQPEQSLGISGRVTTLNGRTVIPGAEVVLITTDSIQFVMDTVTDEQGRFRFDNLIFEDGISFMVQARSENRKNNVRISIDQENGIPMASDRLDGRKMPHADPGMDQYAMHATEEFKYYESLGLKSKITVIDEVTVYAARIKEVTQYSSNLNGPGNADFVLTMDDMESCINLLTCLAGRLPGVHFQNGFAYLFKFMTTSVDASPRMLIVVDGLQYDPGSDISPLSFISPMDVASVEVLKYETSYGIYGSSGSAGVLIITTKSGDVLANDRSDVNFNLTQAAARGFHTAREYYAPVYDVAEFSSQVGRDLRSTIHWEPNIVTDEKGRAEFEFYTADGPGNYLITVEGIDLQGRIGRHTQRIKVEK